MGLKSTSDRYGTVAIAIHWVTAVLIIGMMIAGVLSASSQDEATKIAILSFHAPIGMGIFVLTLARIAWWAFADKKPIEIDGQTPARALVSKWVYRLFYVMLIAMPASGFILFRFSGAADVIFNGAQTALPVFSEFNAFYVHVAGGAILAALLVLHVGAALYHQFILKDRILKRMGVGQ
jgi:cytochrome b561